MGFCSEFKEFAVRGNVVDMAVGVVSGGAFGKIVTSFVNDIVMPPLGKLVGDVDFSNLYINLTDKQFANLAEAKKETRSPVSMELYDRKLSDKVR